MNRKEVVSFDIFDTLITRLIYNPDDIFMLMERKIYNEYNLKLDYLKVRKEAEAKATAKKGAFVIFTIYMPICLIKTWNYRKNGSGI